MSASNNSEQVEQLINPADVIEPRPEGGNDLLTRISLTFGDDIGDDELPMLDSLPIDENEQPEGV
jgi:hypothetical protein